MRSATVALALGSTRQFAEMNELEDARQVLLPIDSSPLRSLSMPSTSRVCGACQL